MKCDFLGRPLNKGDKVVFMQVGYRQFLTGTIASLGEKKATIEHAKTNVGSTQSLQFYDQIIKVQ